MFDFFEYVEEEDFFGFEGEYDIIDFFILENVNFFVLIVIFIMFFIVLIFRFVI